ncbi:unnamed protein product, partial [Mesorhabditis belari]|uniref:Skp1-related protein n=1 Tax=Mesorhabditis belari TaxID=2138241 RepID=A0AAF3EUT4_9BILA
MTGSGVFYKVKTIDGEVLKISKQAADRSGMLVELLRNCPMDDVKNMDPIVLDRAKGTIVKMIIQWCEDHKNRPIVKDVRWGPDTDTDTETKRKSQRLQKKESKLLDLDGDQLFDLFEASNWMDVRCLRQMISKILAAMIRGKKYTEIRTLWRLEGDFTAEEEARNSTENALEILVNELDYLETDLITKHEAEEVTDKVAAINGNE